MPKLVINNSNIIIQVRYTLPTFYTKIQESHREKGQFFLQIEEFLVEQYHIAHDVMTWLNKASITFSWFPNFKETNGSNLE